MPPRRTWHEKLHDSKGLPRVEPVGSGMRKSWGEGTVAIPAPLEVDAAMRRVRSGRLTTINELRDLFARRHHANFGCPITTGIFAWIAAHAAQEAEDAGVRRVTPWWRTLKSGGELNPKYPGGLAQQQARLEAEGHQIIRKGKRAFVADFEHSLARLTP